MTEVATEMHAGPLLEIDSLVTEFVTDRGPLRAVNGVSYSVLPGETLGVVGESGSGKSVTVMSLLRLLPPSARIVSGSVKPQLKSITMIAGRWPMPIRWPYPRCV